MTPAFTCSASTWLCHLFCKCLSTLDGGYVICLSTLDGAVLCLLTRHSGS